MTTIKALDGFPRSRGEYSTDYLKRVLNSADGLSAIEGMSYTAIALRIECPKSTVADIVKDFKQKEFIDKKTKKPITVKAAREINSRIIKIQKEIIEIRKLIKYY